jgi:hypothetical protein
MSTVQNTKVANDILSYVKRAFGDESGVQITDSDILMWANEAQLDIANSTRCIQGKASTTLTAGTFELDLPEQAASSIVTLRLDNTPIPGVEFSQAEQNLQREDPERKQAGRPEWWTKWGTTVTFYPTPTEDCEITVFYTGIPENLVGAASVVGVPDRYFSALLQYVMSKAYELDEDYDAQQRAMADYEQKIGKATYDDDQAMNLFYATVKEVE